MNDIEIRHLCPLPHRGNAPQIHPPATICDHCARQIAQRVADITRWWHDIDSLAQTAGSGSGRGFESKPPVRLDIIALTDPNTSDDGDIPPAAAILIDLGNWIADQRGLTTVYTATAALERLRVHGAALTDHTDPQAVDGDIYRVWSHISRLVGESRPAKALALPCNAPHPDPQVDGECGGEMWSTGRQTGVLARCRECDAEITDTAVMLDVMQRYAAEQRFTATHIPIRHADTNH